MAHAPRIFYGWWMVAACVLVTLVGNALGLFGAGVYLHAMIAARGWPIGLVSDAITLFYVVSAALMIPVGSAIGRFGPRPVIALGAIALAIGVTAIGHAGWLWQIYPAFVVLGLGWSCLSTTAVATTLAPWFERHQGRAMAIASLGASAGGMIGVPALLFGIGRVGFAATTILAGLLAVAVLGPLAGFVLRRRPQDMNLLADGRALSDRVAPVRDHGWTRGDALRTGALRSVTAGFAIGMMVQVGFLTSQVTLIAPKLGIADTAATVSATAGAALLGRLALAGFADRIDLRRTAGVALALAATALGLLGLAPPPTVVVGACVIFGLTAGNVTTLAPLIVRREFGAGAFGRVFGVASCGIQLGLAMGPTFYGSLHDAFGSYRAPLVTAAALDIVAAGIVVSGRRTPRRRPA